MNSLVELQNLHNFHTDKNTTHSYLPYYDSIFLKYLNKPITLLEIGIFHGGSLKLWEKYFGDNLQQYFIDVHLGNINWEYTEIKNATIIYKNIISCTDKFLQPIKFDIIIDDGSHTLEHQKMCYELFKNRLNPGGVFIIEDLQPQAFEYFSELVKTEPNTFIIDLRHIKGKYDDLLFIYQSNNS